MSWAGRSRVPELPADWERRVMQTKRRARGKCEAEQHHPDCDGRGAECDHHDGRNNHDLSNLRWLNALCHGLKTQAEAQTALNAMRAKATHPREKPFGLL